MEIETSLYGTKGLPKFGAIGVNPTTSEAAITEVDAAFNTLINTLKKHTAVGNESALWYFGMRARGLYGIARDCVSGKPVVNG